MTIFSQIEELIPRLHGWCSPHRAVTLASAVLCLRPERSMVIGVWGGRDTFAMALAHREIKKGKVIGIDPWSAAASIQGQSQANVGFWQDQGMHEVVYADFLKQKSALHIDEYISVQRMISDYYQPVEPIGVLSLDGNHGMQALTDAKRFGPTVQRGGLIFLDDKNWQEGEGGGGVKPAIEFLKGIGFAELYDLEGGVTLQKL